MNEHIFLVEDDPNLGFVIKDSLGAQDFRVTHLDHGLKAKERFQKGEFDLCLLDVMLPGMDGFEIARHIRQEDPHIPIIFLTAKDQEEDRINGFLLGGDDYITKPFSIKELILRVRVFLRRSAIHTQSKQQIQLGGSFFDPDNLQIEKNGNEKKLTQREADLLHYLALRQNKLCKREEILLEIWGDDDYFLGRSLDVFVSRLRKHLESEPSVKIVNHHGVGFMLTMNQE